MKKYRIISLVLAIAIMICSISPLKVTVAENPSDPKNDAPFIFISGLNGWGDAEGINKIIPYWGSTSCDILSILKREGYECYAASVGPQNSAWDRACELYAQLLGTTVDYGEVHSRQHNHDRYGRTYDKPLIYNWGGLDENSKTKQIHLIGHSFGGTTVRMFAHLLSEGASEEVAASGSDVSGLFKGDKELWVKSVTTICASHNSGTIYYPLEALGICDFVRNACYLLAGILGRSFLNGRLVDFHLEHFGLTDGHNGEKADGLIEAMRRLQANSDDSCIYDLTPEGAAKLNDRITVNENIYYFSYSYRTTKKNDFLNVELPFLNTNPVIILAALAMGIMPEFTDEYTGIVYDNSWRINDGLVNTESEKYPIDEPHKDFDKSNIEKGLWNVMPVRTGDHGDAIGLFNDEKSTQALYFELAEMLRELP